MVNFSPCFCCKKKDAPLLRIYYCNECGKDAVHWICDDCNLLLLKLKLSTFNGRLGDRCPTRELLIAATLETDSRG